MNEAVGLITKNFINDLVLSVRELLGTADPIVVEALPYLLRTTDIGRITKQKIPSGGNLIISAKDFDESATVLPKNAFANDNEILSLVLSDNVQELSGYTCYECREVASVVFGENITTVGSWEFYGCYKLQNVTLNSKLETLGKYMFADCNSLSYLEIPASVSLVNNYALWCAGPTNKATFKFLGTTPPTIGTATFYEPFLEKIIVPKGYGEIYKSATNWSAYADYIEEATE